VAEDKKDVSFTAPWVENLRHRPDPNRVNDPHAPSLGQFTPRPPAAKPIPADPATLHLGRTPPAPSSLAARYDPQVQPAEPSYYDIPMLKQPVWKWEIATYFFLGGVSAGAYVLGRAADRAGGEKYCDVARMAAYVAMGALIPCPPLLIKDLGDPKRFHHMLRVWKPSTPMNFGTWSIVAYSGMAAYEAIRQYLSDRQRALPTAERAKLLKLMNNGTLLLLHDAAGVPFSIIVAGYTGVLLSCTSNPLWCKNPYLGPLFSASAIATGAEAISLALDLTQRDTARHSPSHRVLRQVDSVAHAAELVLSAAFMRFAGDKAKTLRTGKNSRLHKFSMRGIIAAEILKLLPIPDSFRRPIRMLINLLGLSAGLGMRWSMVFGGHEAAADPHTARLVSRPQDPSKQIGGTMKGAGGRLAHAGQKPAATRT
jgi:formate-dependent nitrite reductase membrane component NrfD